MKTRMAENANIKENEIQKEIKKDAPSRLHARRQRGGTEDAEKRVSFRNKPG